MYVSLDAPPPAPLLPDGFSANSTCEIPSESSARRVLVIDDSVLIRAAVKVALATIGGWGVVTAASGEHGIELAELERPDAILLDVVMPGLDGIAVAERLHAMPLTRHFPVVLITARDRLEDRELFARLPVAGVIGKPFAIAGLARELSALLGWPQ